MEKETANTLEKTVKELAKEELESNRAVFESLRDYDEGKKDISTTNVKKHLGGLINK